MNITAHGKILLTGEYFVLDGAWALALPVRYGQSLCVVPSGGTTTYSLRWESRDYDGSLWFSAEYALPSLQVLHSNDAATAHTLAALLLTCRRRCPDFLQQPMGLSVMTQTDFPRAWGLGTSSTLIAALGRWSGADPYAVLFETLGGSGYDIACAFAEGPILYRLEGQNPQVQAVEFAPRFAEQLYFVYLGKKQDSRDGIRRYREQAAAQAVLTDEVSELTRACLRAQSLADFEAVLAEHERLVAQSMGLIRAKDLFFNDFWGEVKSLGAWGGDFVLVSSERGEAATRQYFQEKGFGTLLSWKAMMG